MLPDLDGLKDSFDNQLNQLKKIPRPVTIGLICVFGVVLLGRILPPILWPGGIGIGKDSPVSTKTIEKDAQGKTVKTIETIKYDDGKTLWDWGSLLGVPLGVPLLLAILGYVLQEQQRKIADNETKEEVLQTYFDRLSVLLIDKNLIALSNKSNLPKITSIPLSNKSQSSTITPEEQELLDSSLDVIRARTLSILRRFENDAERKTSVIKFLIETEIVGKSKLDLSGADLSGANLSGANLSGAKLHGANFSGANLSGVNFRGADLVNAFLSGAFLSDANLSEAKLSGANLNEAFLFHANLSGANLDITSFIGANLCVADLSAANLREANLSEAKLYGANLRQADLRFAKLSNADFSKLDFYFPNVTFRGISEAILSYQGLTKANIEDIKWDSGTVWPDKSQFDNAINIPEDLKKELGITP